MTLAAIVEHIGSLHRPLILDGGLATELEARGHSLDDHLWSGSLLLHNPAAIIEAHIAFIEAGAECIISASYQASRAGFRRLGLDDQSADNLIASSVDLAHAAVEQTSASGCLVAASIGPFGATLHDGSEYTGSYAAATSELRDFHAQRLDVLAAAGADLLACETIPCKREAEVLAGLLESFELPAWISFCCRDEQSLSDGTPVAEAGRMFSGLSNVFAIGVNCTAPRFVPGLLDLLQVACADKLLVAYPNSGERYVADNGSWHGDNRAEDFARGALSWYDHGAALVGGCCRVGPDHIRSMVRAFS